MNGPRGGSWPEAIQAFLAEEEVMTELELLARNCSRPEIFNDRFFQVFNAFRILKFLNFTHERFYQKKALELCIAELDGEVNSSQE